MIIKLPFSIEVYPFSKFYGLRSLNPLLPGNGSRMADSTLFTAAANTFRWIMNCLPYWISFNLRHNVVRLIPRISAALVLENLAFCKAFRIVRASESGSDSLRERFSGSRKPSWLIVSPRSTMEAMVIGRAEDFGLTGFETAADLDENRDFLERMEAIRITAGRRMGMGDVRESVIPKFSIIAPPGAGGSCSARYFMPWQCHPSMAVTGA